MSGDYFDPGMCNRQRLLWAIATRRQLERWEGIVAPIVREGLANRQPGGAAVWSAEIERHFTLVAGAHLMRALALPPAAKTPVDKTLRAELIEGRDLQEHWVQNMPLFNVQPRVAEPTHSTGRAFAARNPARGPYSQYAWSDTTGARLLPHVTAPALHQLLDAVEDEVPAEDPALAEYITPRAASPWVHEDGEWWPKPEGA
jgi:hypothetical protein